ncbi:MAG: PQQ-dependent sugar dehydrogenase [Verrucomicrobia bacterium]|nr:PQQ-dependent sugar dehydrogenase [Verrucomicrobiota bacterium]
MTVPPRNAFAIALLVTAMILDPRVRAQSGLRSTGTSGVAPAHDPPDIPFRRAPMGLSSRTIVISLATNLHLAFDAELLRTHTVWEGAPLNLYGPPFNNTATRFICDFTGNLLWGNLPVQPWEMANTRGRGFDPANTRFLGVSTRENQTSFLYELVAASGVAVRVRETSRAERVLSHRAVVRRFEIGPLVAPVRFAAFHGPGESVSLPAGESALAIRREKDFLLVGARGVPANALISRQDEVARAVHVQSERDGKGPYSAVVTNLVSGPHVQLSIELPRSANGQIVEVAVMVCANQTEATALTKAFAAGSIKSATTVGKGAFHRVPDFSLDSERAKNLRDGRDGDSRSEGRAEAADSRRVGSQSTLASIVNKPSGDESYIVEHFPVPKEIKLLVGGMDFLPNGDLAMCTYAGEVWIVEGATGDPAQARWRRFARGLNEPGGLRVINGKIHVTQKCELTRLSDTDGNGEADLFECLSDGWGYTGNYHSYATGPALDAQGNFYVMITGHRPIYHVPFMGWCVRVSREVQSSKSNVQSSSPGVSPPFPRFVTEGFCSGLRVPNGFGEFNGELFMTDNQGHWIAANKLNHLQSSKFYGYPSAQPAPRTQFNGDTNFTPPAVWFPYAWVRSASGIAAVADDRFGPFQGQMLVGEFQNASVVRVALEKVNGEWQGTVFPFVKGFGSGVNRLAFGPDGQLYAGGLRMGHWTSIAPQPHSLDRVRFTGKTPFEIREVRAQPGGFDLTFTRPVDAASTGDTENWDALQYTYGYDGQHNAPEKDRDEKIAGPPVRVTKATVSADRKSVRLQIEGCQPRHVILVRALDVKSADGQKLRHDTFHYTLNQLRL